MPHLGKGLASFRFWKSDYEAFLWVSVGKRSITPCIQIFVCFLYIYSLAFFPPLALLARSWQSFRGGARILQKGLCSQRYVSFIWTVRNSHLMWLDTDTDMQTTHVKYILLWIPGTGFFMGVSCRYSYQHFNLSFWIQHPEDGNQVVILTSISQEWVN